MNREFFEKLKFHEESYNKIQVYSKSFIGTLNNNIGYGKNKIDALIDLIVKTAKIQRYGNSLLSYDKSQDKKGNYKIIFYNVVNEPIFTLDFGKKEMLRDKKFNELKDR